MNIIIYRGKIYGLDRIGYLYVITLRSKDLVISKPVIDRPVTDSTGFQKRLAIDEYYMYAVVHMEDDVVEVYKTFGQIKYTIWYDVEGFENKEMMLLMSRDYSFWLNTNTNTKMREFENCVVISKGAFPKLGDGSDGWEVSQKNQEDFLTIRLYDVNEDDNLAFPKLNWSPPRWVFNDPPESSESESDPENDNDLDSNSEDETDEEMESPSNCEDELDDDNVAEGTSLKKKKTRQSVLGACTSSKCPHKSATAKFEGFDVRADLIPTLDRIWVKHGNIVENSTMRTGGMLSRVLEMLAIVAQILDDNSAESLSDSQADCLRLSLSDFEEIRIKVDWLAPFVEKALKMHKTKALMDSVNKLSQSSSQVKERKAALNEELAKLSEEENKLQEEMANLSEMIPISDSDQVTFDEPFGSGLL